jgi:hypothetical protein
LTKKPRKWGFRSGDASSSNDDMSDDASAASSSSSIEPDDNQTRSERNSKRKFETTDEARKRGKPETTSPSNSTDLFSHPETTRLTGSKRKRDAPETIEPKKRVIAHDLRSRAVEEKTILKQSRSFRDKVHYVYPSSSGPRSAETRKAMGPDVTRDLFNRNHSDPFTPAIARSVKPLSKDDTRHLVYRDGKKPSTKANKPRDENFQLKQAGASRNHILADSRIRVMLESIAKGDKVKALQSNGKERKALVNFFEAISGKGPGTEQAERFIKALWSGNKKERNSAIDDVTLGRENLRFGHADVNGKISNEFDPVIVDGRLDPRSMKIRDAVIGLGSQEVGLLKSQKKNKKTVTVLDVLAVTKDRFTHQDVSSSVISSRNNKMETRTRIDHFAGPANPFRRTRSHSIDLGSLGDKPRLSSNVRLPEVARSPEFHHLSRPGLPEFE